MTGSKQNFAANILIVAFAFSKGGVIRQGDRTILGKVCSFYGC